MVALGRTPQIAWQRRIAAASILLAAIATQETRALWFPYKRIHNASHAITLTPDEWASEFDECHVNQTAGGTGAGAGNEPLPLPRECFREQNSWLVKHNEEMWHAYRFLVHEQSIDERYANLVYGFNSRAGIYYHHYKFNTGQPERDALLPKLVAGARVDDRLCTQHLRQMAALLDDLAWRVARKRATAAAGPTAANETPLGPSQGAAGEDTKLDERHFRLARVLDSFGRYESGHLSGRYHSFGMYNQCVRTQMLLARGDGPLVGSRYCWARMDLDGHLSARLRNRSALDYNIGDLKFHLATCLPESCHSKSFMSGPSVGAADAGPAGDDAAAENRALVQRILESQFKRPRAMWLDQSLPVESVFCLVDADSQVARMGPGGKLLIGLLLLWLSLCVFATLKRRAKHQVDADGELVLPVTVPVQSPNSGRLRAGAATKKSLWSQLDLFESWHDFIGTNEVSRGPDAPVDLDTLNPIKALSGGAVIVVHSILLAAPLNVNGLETYAIMENNRPEMLMVTGVLVIDALFVLTGMLMAFIVLKRLSKQRGANYSLLGANFYLTWLFISASRYLRLVPLYLLTFWFKKTVFPHLGSGPNWDYGLNRDTLIGACQQESWASPLTPMTAFTPLLSQCLPQSWSISNDLVFAFLVPPFILALHSHFRATSMVIAALTVSAIHAGYYVIYLAIEPQYRFMLEQLTARGVIMMFRVASELYTSPVYRVPAIFIGVFAGFALFRYERKQREKLERLRGPADRTTGGGGGCDAFGACAETEFRTPAAGATQPKAPAQGASHRIESGWPRWFRGFASQQAVVYVLISFALALCSKEFRDHTSQETKTSAIRFFFLNGHFNFSLAMAIIFLRMVTDWRSSWLMRIFSMRIFRSLAKLAYPMILIHWDILYYDAVGITQATLANKWQFGRATTMTYMYAWPLSVLIHLVLENPIDKLTKTYLLGGSSAVS